MPLRKLRRKLRNMKALCSRKFISNNESIQVFTERPDRDDRRATEPGALFESFTASIMQQKTMFVR